jgi:hypothetical protein
MGLAREMSLKGKKPLEGGPSDRPDSREVVRDSKRE